ncbi:MAG: hypothetical protein ABMA64_08355 [Myxococcota bacterium]
MKLANQRDQEAVGMIREMLVQVARVGQHITHSSSHFAEQLIGLFLYVGEVSTQAIVLVRHEEHAAIERWAHNPKPPASLGLEQKHWPHPQLRCGFWPQGVQIRAVCHPQTPQYLDWGAQLEDPTGVRGMQLHGDQWG